MRCVKALCNLFFILVPLGLFPAHSFFSIPVPFHPTSPERQTMTHDELRDYEIGKWHNFTITCFGGESTNPDRLATFFMPFEKESLLVGGFGSEAVKQYKADVMAQYFDILTGLPPSDSSTTKVEDNIFDIIDTWTFESCVKFCPKHKYFGIGLTYKQHLSSTLRKGFWFELAMPIMAIKNNMGMCEKIITSGGPNGDDPQCSASFFTNKANQYAYHNMTCAMQGSRMKFGKISPIESRRTKWGVADIEGRVGYTYFREPWGHLSSYMGVLLSTGNTPNAKYMFEKIIGYNGHTGFFFGTRGGFKIWEHDFNFLSLEFDTGATLFLDKTQVRSFDLKGKPWSRYIWVYPASSTISAETNINPSLSPGINYFTKSVRVDYGSIRNLNMAGVYSMKHFEGELGYHFYSRDREKVCLVKPWKEEPALAAIWYSNNNFIGSADPRVSRNSATIDNYLLVHNDVKEFKSFSDIVDPSTRSEALKNNDTYIPINACDLDLDSAANPSVVIHTLYASLGWGWYEAALPTKINIAGGYEFGNGPAVMDRWKLWGRFIISF